MTESGPGMNLEAMKVFIHDHFEEFVNRKNLDIADVNFAADFVDHGADVPPGTPAGPVGAKEYFGSALKKFPDMRVTDATNCSVQYPPQDLDSRTTM
jgi:hypothetical protein